MASGRRQVLLVLTPNCLCRLGEAIASAHGEAIGLLNPLVLSPMSCCLVCIMSAMHQKQIVFQE